MWDIIAKKKINYQGPQITWNENQKSRESIIIVSFFIILNAHPRGAKEKKNTNERDSVLPTEYIVYTNISASLSGDKRFSNIRADSLSATTKHEMS